VGGEDTETTEAERRRKKDERRASRALKRLSASTGSDSHGNGLDEVVTQATYPNNPAHGRAMSIEQVIEDDRARRERVGLKGMDEVLDKLRAAAGVAPAARPGRNARNDSMSAEMK
jgi:predicted phosphohydrolase